MARIILQQQKINGNVWVRNTIECPIQEFIRRTVNYKLSSIYYFADAHDSLVNVLYPNAQKDVSVELNEVKGKVDAVDGDKVIEHKRITAPVSVLLASPSFLTAIAQGTKEILSSFLSLNPYIEHASEIKQVTAQGCEDKYPFTVGCIARSYFNIELYAKKFYELTNRMVSEHIFTLLPEEIIALSKLIRETKQKTNVFTIETVAIGALQAKVYSELLSKLNNRNYTAILSITVTPRYRLQPAINIEYDVSKIRYSIDTFMKAVEVAKNPRKYRLDEIKEFKNKPCTTCDLRAVCPFRKTMEKYDREIIEKSKELTKQVIRNEIQASTEILFMNSP